MNVGVAYVYFLVSRCRSCYWSEMTLLGEVDCIGNGFNAAMLPAMEVLN